MKTSFRTVEALGHPTRALDIGSGPAAVVLHGWGGRIESMMPVVRCLQASSRVIALDLPGFGESPAPPGVWGTPDYAEYVADVLRQLDVDRACFVGHSFGAKTSLYLAATHGRHVEKLVLVGSPGLRDAPSAKVRVKRAIGRGAKGLDVLGPPGRALKRRIHGAIASKDYAEAGPMRPVLVRVVNEDLASIMREVPCPTLLVWGSKDDAVPLGHARRMEALIPDAGLVVFEGAGHFAYLDEPQRFCTIVDQFFKPDAKP